METIKLEFEAKTRTGSHTEITKATGQTPSKEITVNDYNAATVTVNVPKSVVDNTDFYGVDRYADLARCHETVLIQNLIRATLAESTGKTQEEKNAIAQAAVANFPTCLDPKPKVPGAAKASKKQKERTTALELTEDIVGKPYANWNVKTREKFDARYPEM